MKIIVFLFLIASPFAGPRWGPALLVGLAGLLVYLAERDREDAEQRLRNMEQERGLAEQGEPTPELLRWQRESRLLDTRRSGRLVRGENTEPTRLQ